MAEGGSGTNMWLLEDYTPINYARGCSPLLLNHLPLEESTLITYFFIYFFEVHRLLSISAVGRYSKIDVLKLLWGDPAKYYGQG